MSGPRLDRARGCLVGLAVGDALGRPAENLTRAEIAERWGRITGFLDEAPAGTDDTEYTAFSALLLVEHGHRLTAADAATAWRRDVCAQDGGLKGAGFSERCTAENLRRGLEPPASAHHPHAWSDGLAMRAAAHGVFAAGDPAEAARLAGIDGLVSHAGEGLYGGQAVAAGIAAALGGADPAGCLAAALAAVPADSWTAANLRTAGRIAGRYAGTNGAAEADRDERLETELVDALVVTDYPWTDLAPEAVALAFGAYLARPDHRAVLTAVNMGRDADTTAAIAGALVGAAHGLRGPAGLPAAWTGRIGPVAGSCLRAVAGVRLDELADRLVERAERDRAEREFAERKQAGQERTERDRGKNGPREAGTGRPGPGLGTAPTEESQPARTRRPATEKPVPHTADPRLDRARGALLGLAVGDAAGWPALHHRAAPLPAWTRRLRRELDGFAETHQVSTVAVPFALNQPVDGLGPGPGDDAEWAAWTARWLLAGARPAHRSGVHQAWEKLAADRPERARISVRAALAALAGGVRPPWTGRHNPHFFDDAAAVRAVVFGLAAATLEDAVRLAGWDAAVTNAEDGLAAARAVAAAVWTGSRGCDPAADVSPPIPWPVPDWLLDITLNTALAQLPADSGIRADSERWVALGRRLRGGPAPAFTLVGTVGPELDRAYSYGVSAAETVAVALGLLATGASPAEAVPAAACLARLADSAPALTGALTGAVFGAATVPDPWLATCRTLAGCCLPELAGLDLFELADRLAAAEIRAAGSDQDRPTDLTR